MTKSHPALAAPPRLAPLLFPTLRGLTPAMLPGEVVAALMLLAIAVPEQLATARLMGLPPITGLIAFVAGTVAFAAFGLSRSLSVGADSTIAPIMAAALALLAAPGSPHYAALAGMLATLTGVLLILSRPLRLGWIADLLSVPVTTGFLAGIAVHIVAGALPPILNLTATGTSLPERLADLFRQLPQADPVTAALGIGVTLVGLGADRIGRRVPGPLIALALAAGAVTAFALQVPMLAALPHTLPGPRIELPGFDEVMALLPLAGVTALVVMMQTAAVRQGLPDTADADPGRDFAAIGAGAVLSALLGSFAVNSSPPRSAALEAAGARSQASGLIAVALTVGLIVFGAGAFAWLPQAALNGVLLMVGLRLFHLGTMRKIARKSPAEVLLVAAAALLVIFLPVNQGVWLAIMLALAHALYSIARPACTELQRVPGTTIWWALGPGEAGERVPGVLVFALGAPVNFLNARFMVAHLRKAVATAPTPPEVIVIEATGVIGVDFTGGQILQDAVTALRAEGHQMVLARLENERAEAAAARTGLIAAFGQHHVYHSVEEAVEDRTAKAHHPKR
ncbi:MAG: STAS domain-containing protein [Rhodobacteraceae bacterium]|nr:STAS domain-containing protein [Paracoccaceae bacterium]